MLGHSLLHGEYCKTHIGQHFSTRILFVVAIFEIEDSLGEFQQHISNVLNAEHE